MIDSHCHLESEDYDKDREQVIERCMEQMKAVVTSCVHPKDFQKTMNIVENHKGFVFTAVGIHPEYIKEIIENEKDEYLDIIKSNKDRIVSIGEVGLDYFWIKESDWQQKQRELFVQMIGFSKEIRKPLTVHSREAYEDVVKILEKEDAKDVHLHLFGSNTLVKRIVDNGWYVSIGPIVLGSKKHFQIARDMPMDKILLETDAPWNHPKVFTEHMKERNEPVNVKFVAEKIAEIKKMKLQEVIEATTENATRLFNLNL